MVVILTREGEEAEAAVWTDPFRHPRIQPSLKIRAREYGPRQDPAHSAHESDLIRPISTANPLESIQDSPFSWAPVQPLDPQGPFPGSTMRNIERKPFFLEL